MNPYCIDLLGVPEAIVNSQELVPDFFEQFQTQAHLHLEPEHINPEFVYFLKQHRLTYPEIDVINVRPNQHTFVHSDNDFLDDMPKLNWIYGGKASVMNWYEMRPGTTVPEPERNAVNGYRIRWDHRKLRRVHSQPVQFPSLVQTGVPHNIFNGAENRCCVSVPLGWDRGNGQYSKFQRPTFQECAVMFKEYIGADN